MQILGYTPAEPDSCLFVKKIGEHLSFILRYVDDMLEEQYEKVKAQITKIFMITCLGEVNNYLGI